MASHPYNYGPVIPVPNAQILGDCLANGQLTVATALAQISHFVRETLKAIEKFSEQQAKLYSEGKTKLDKMDRIIHELSEKCQAMQQALLFKEEKFDEKCRDLERYKMICEMAAEDALKPPTNILDYYDPNNNHVAGPNDRDGSIIKLEHTRSGVISGANTRSLAKHAKFSESQAHLSQYISPFQFGCSSPTKIRDGIESSMDDERKLMAHYYAGGPSKRISPMSRRLTNRYDTDSSVRDKLEIIGGVNVKSPQIDAGPVPLNRLIDRPIESSYNEESNKRVKIDVTGQRNEVLSSSGNNAQRMKQRIVERDLPRLVARAPWTRLASRRKKDWPF